MVGAAARLATRTVSCPGEVTVFFDFSYEGVVTMTAELYLGLDWLYDGVARVDWGDGSVTTDVVPSVLSLQHRYESFSGGMRIAVTGRIRKLDPGDDARLISFLRQDGTSLPLLRGVSVEDDSPNGLQEMSGFVGSQYLAGVRLPHRLTALGEYAFSGCQALSDLIVPTAVSVIGRRAFSHCAALRSIGLPEFVTEVRDYVFEECYMLESVRLSDKVTRIGNRAFFNCFSLGGIDLPPELVEIGPEAFAGCTSLQTIDVPGSVVSIGAGAFKTTPLFSVGLSEGLESIGADAFYGCSSLSSLDVPATCTSVGQGFLCGTMLETDGGELTFRCPQVMPYADPFAPHEASWTSTRVLYVPEDLVDAYVLSGWGGLFNVSGISQT